MNKLLRLLKGKSFAGIGKLTKVAWIFKISPNEVIDADIPEKKIGVPEFFHVLSGASAPEATVESSVFKISPVKPMKGSVEIEATSY